jgi:membrane-associated phospholipid phosphatase
MLYTLWLKIRELLTGTNSLQFQTDTMSAGPAYEQFRDLFRKQVWYRDWFGNTLRERWPLLLFIIAFQSLYFPINQIVSGGVHLYIPQIDGEMPRLSIFVIPYAMGFVLMPLFPIIAAWKFSRQVFQEYAIAFFAIMVIGFTIWLLFPAYIVKHSFEPNGFFDDLLYNLHDGDSTYGTHNSFPSSHVYYVTLAMVFFWRKWPKQWVIWGTFTVVNAVSTLFTLQHYFVDVVSGFALTWFVIWLTRTHLLPIIRRREVQFGVADIHGKRLPRRW